MLVLGRDVGERIIVGNILVTLEDVRGRSVAVTVEEGKVGYRKHLRELESVRLAPDVFLRLLRVRGRGARFGILAPRTVSVYREEVFESIKAEDLLGPDIGGEGGGA